MSRALQDKTVIVTGAGQSVGRAVARRAAEEGARVMLACEDAKGLAETVKDLGGDGARVGHFGCNLEQRLSVTNLLSATKDAYGRIDVLVDAARNSATGAFLDVDGDAFDAAYTDNVRNVFTLAQATARRMIAQSEDDPDFRGAIVTVTSIAA
ncbi:MAG: SDR family NAD(P)-dependent oxidoreductase, partial [Pseudomonadota bacterium]